MEELLKQLQTGWFLIICIAGIIFAVATNVGTISDHEKRLAKVESQNVELLASLNRIEVDIAIVRTKLENKTK